MALFATVFEAAWLGSLNRDDLIKIATTEADFCGEYILLDNTKPGSDVFVNTQRDTFQVAVAGINKPPLTKIIAELSRRSHLRMITEVNLLAGEIFNPSPDRERGELSRRMRIFR